MGSYGIELADDACRITGDHGMRRHISGNNCTGANDSASANFYTPQNDGACAYQCIVFNNDRGLAEIYICRVTIRNDRSKLKVSCVRIKRMSMAVEDVYSMRYKHPIANSDLLSSPNTSAGSNNAEIPDS